MAEIKIEKKRQIWPWIIVIIVLAVLAFLYFYGSETPVEESVEMEEIGCNQNSALKTQQVFEV